MKEQSQAVIDIDEQYEVFDNPKASDPTHSILAKDHVDLILNEPAGRVAQIVVENTVRLVVHVRLFSRLPYSGYDFKLRYHDRLGTIPKTK